VDLKLVLGVLKEGLKLWGTKEATKYIDRVIKLEGEYYDELKKPYHDRSQLYLDERLHELATIARNFVGFGHK
jgi:hypothetical protein